MVQNKINCFKKCTACNSLKVNSGLSPTCMVSEAGCHLTIKQAAARK